MLHHSSGSSVRIILQFYTMKGAKRDMGVTLMVFLKEILFRAISSFCNKNGMWICCQVSWSTLHNNRDQEVRENFISRFLRKNIICSNLTFSGHFLMFDWVWSKLSQTTVTIAYLNLRTWLRSLNSQDSISQVNVYVGDSVLRYYMIFMYGGQYST